MTKTLDLLVGGGLYVKKSCLIMVSFSGEISNPILLLLCI
jgi:hypothetical protein